MQEKPNDISPQTGMTLHEESFAGRDPWEVIAEICAVVKRLVEENEGLREESRTLREENRALKEENRLLGEEVGRLKSRINTDSHNSHKPPSSDGFKKKNRSLRIPGQHPAGGQPGHPGSALQMVENPDAVLVHSVDSCGGCGCSLENVQTSSYDRGQVFDLPPRRFVVTEHRGEVKNCPFCGAKNRAVFPRGVLPGAQYGPNVYAVVAYLMEYQMIPYERAAEFFSDLFNQNISAGTFNTVLMRAYQMLEEHERLVKEDLIHSAVGHFDETGARCKDKRRWLHVASTPSATYYSIQDSRGVEGINAAGILPHFTGVAVHDSWKSYFGYPCAHALCNVHHLRELKFAYEEEQAQWAKKMIEWLLNAKNAIEEAPSLPEETLRCYEQEYHQILEEGLKEYPPPEPPVKKKRGRKKQTKSKNLLDRMMEKTDYVLAFLSDASIPFDNNLGERDIRMMKVKQKISGTFRSIEGAQWFCRIRGYISTVKKQGHNVMEALTNVFLGKPFLPVVQDTD